MKSRLYVIVFMVAIAAVFGAAVSGLHLVSQPRLERNRRLRMQEAYVRVFGLADGGGLSATEVGELVDSRLRMDETVVDPETGEAFTLIEARSEDGAVKAYGFRFGGMGLWGPIEGVISLSPDLRRTTGLVVLEQKETPGLGGRIEEPIFTEQFSQDGGVYVALPEEKDSPVLTISSDVPQKGTERYRRHVDAITGATQTCMAMERILNENLVQFGRAMAARGS